MLMQPQSPDPQFDFMLKDSPQPKRGLVPAIPKTAKIILAAVLGIFLLVIIIALISGRNKGSTQGIVSVMARNQEIIRVTDLAQQLQLEDPQTQALAATVSASLSSDKQRLLDYLNKNKAKASPAQLAADKDTNTDTSLQSASQNNSLDTAYIDYLRSALAKYQADVQTAYKASGPNGQKILSETYESASTLLANPPLKN